MLKCREAGYGDLWSLYELRMALARSEGGDDSPLNLLNLLRQTISWLVEPFYSVDVVTDGERMVGFSTFVRQALLGPKPGACHNTGIYVLPEYRGGRAFALIQRATDSRVEREGWTCLQAYVLVGNTPVLDMCARMGAIPLATIVEKPYGRRGREQRQGNRTERGGSDHDAAASGEPVPQRSVLQSDSAVDGADREQPSDIRS